MRILIIVVFLFVLGCNNEEPKKYEKYTFYKSGKVKEKFVFSSKKDTGSMLNYTGTLFYENGNPHYIMPKKNGKTDGNYYAFYSNGKMKDFIMYNNDTINGVHRGFSENGELVEESLYLKGVHITKMKAFNENSNTVQFFYYMVGGANEEMGRLKFDKEGKIIKEESYYYKVNGKDTVNEGDKYDLDIDVYTFGENNYIQEAVFGDFDKSFNVKDSSKYVFLKSSNNHLHYGATPDKIGQNLIVGRLYIKNSKNSLEKIDRDFIFYKEFFVKPR
jgi:hypothetical protein